MRTRNLTLLAAGLAISAAAPTTVLASAFSGADGRIAFSSNRTGNYEIYSMNPDGSDVRQLTNSPRDDAQAAWSPDGTKIAFASNRAGPELTGQVWLIRPDGSKLTQLTEGEWSHVQPAWSADSRSIFAYQGRETEQYEFGSVVRITVAMD